MYGRLLFSDKVSGNTAIINFNNEQRGLLLIKVNSKIEKLVW
jgi:hypothetical protein